MYQITYQDRIKFEAIKDDVMDYLIEQGYCTFNINYESLCEFVNSAKRKNKTNNSLLKYEDFESVVTAFYLKDEVINECKWYNIKAHKHNTVKLLFIYEILNSQYAPIQNFTHFKNN